MNLKEWAGIPRHRVRDRASAVRGRHAALFPTYKLGRLIMVGEPSADASQADQVVVCARVSTADQRQELDRQVARITAWATGQRLYVCRVVTEIGSALNGHRTSLLALLRDPAVQTIVAEHRDRFARFARFGAEYVEAALAAQGRHLLPNPRHLAAAQRRLRMLGRRLARRVGPHRRTGRRASKRWQRAQRQLARAHARVVDLRRAGLHKLTTSLAGEYGTVAVEDLNVAGMLRNGRLARHVADAGFAQLRRQVAAKRQPGTVSAGETGTVPPQGGTVPVLPSPERTER